MKSIMDMLLAPWANQALFTAIRLKIFTILADKRMALEKISSRLDTVPHYLKPLLDACISMDLILCREGQYQNSQFSRIHLVEGEPEYIGDALQLMSLESVQWNKLYDLIISSDHDSSDQHQGEVNPRLFTLAMDNIGMLGEAEALGNAIDLSGCKTMIDAGGGSGLYSSVLCRKYPELSSTLIDIGKTLTTTREMITGSGQEKRIKLVEADIAKDPLGSDIDVVLLSDVLYESSFAENVLKNAMACLRDKGLLVIRGYYSDPENSKPLLGALFLLNQIMHNPEGSFLTLSSLKEMVADIGFTITQVTPLTKLSFLLLARKQT